MGQPIPINTTSSPTRWLIVFDRRAATWWADLVALGRRKHVRAFRHVFEDVWLFYDVQFRGTVIHVVRYEQARQLVAEWTADADVLSIAAQPSGHWFPRPLLCTVAVARLLGLPCALRPDALYRECLRHGATIVQVAHGAGHNYGFGSRA